MCVNNGTNKGTYFDSFGVENIPKKYLNIIGSKNIMTNVYRIQAYDSIRCGYYCIEFIDFMLKGKIFLIISIYFLLMIMKKKTKYIKTFSITKNAKILCCVICGRYRRFQKVSYLLEKVISLFITCSKYKNEGEKLFREQEPIEIIKFFGLIGNI